MPNVHLLGLRPRSDLAAYMRAADVCLIPYVTTALTRSISPLKLNEYLAAGRPVVSTPFSSALDGYEDCVAVVPDHGFLDAVRSVLADEGRDAPAAVECRLAKARANSWEARADRVAELIEEVW